VRKPGRCRARSCGTRQRFCAVGALYRSAADLLGLDALAHALEAEQFILAANSQSKSLQLIND